MFRVGLFPALILHSKWGLKSHLLGNRIFFNIINYEDTVVYVLGDF